MDSKNGSYTARTEVSFRTIVVRAEAVQDTSREGAPGTHRFRLDGTGLPAGVYVVRATGGVLDFSRRVTLVR